MTTARKILEELWSDGWIQGDEDIPHASRESDISDAQSSLAELVEGLANPDDDWNSLKFGEGYNQALTDVVALLKGEK